MSTEQLALSAMAEHWPRPPQGVAAAVDRARGQGVVRPIAAEGSLLRLVARARGARAAVTTVTHGGVLPLWILQGMPTDGALTCIDAEPAASMTRTAALGAGVPQHRWRIIPGEPASSVLGRLRDRAYDLVVVDAAAPDLPAQIEHAERLTRSEGLVVLWGVGLDGALTDPVDRTPGTQRLRDLLADWQERDISATIVPVGAGLALASSP